MQNCSWQLCCFLTAKTAGRKNSFVEDEIVAFGGLKYRIVTIEALHDGKNCHHYEIGMVRYAGKHENQDTRTSGD